MSYILEALKKSEQKHQLGTVPGLHTVHAPLAPSAGRRVWLYLLLAVLAGNAGGLAWWLWAGRGEAPVVATPATRPEVAASSQGPGASAPGVEGGIVPGRVAVVAEPPPVARVEVVAAEPGAAAPELMAARQEVILARQEALMARQETVQTRQGMALPSGAALSRMAAGREAANEPLAAADSGELAAGSEAAATEEAPLPAAPPAEGERAKPVLAGDDDPLSMGLVAIEEGRGKGRPSPARPGTVAKEGKEGGERLPSLNSLPEALRADIPPILISFHSYSTTASASLARINGKIMREGDLLAPGLKLERITPTGVVISFKGERFQVTMS